MLRIGVGLSAAAAVRYFHILSKADHAYHLDGGEVPGAWGGRGAAMLGLSGAVTLEGYVALASNRHPDTGAPLTPRTKQDRRATYDFTFSVPKPASLLHALADPQAVQAAFDEALARTMTEIETAAATRVRRNGQNTDRVTENLVWATYVHRTARPVGGTPDPHLHAHVIVFNQTFDPIEQRWKAVQVGDVKRHAPLYEALFLSHVAEGLEARGYRIEGDDKSWRVVGVPDSVSLKFSRRTQLIEKAAAALGVTDPDRKADLGRRTREPKGPPVPYAELQDQWRARLTPDEAAAVAAVKRPCRASERPAPGGPPRHDRETSREADPTSRHDRQHGPDERRERHRQREQNRERGQERARPQQPSPEPEPDQERRETEPARGTGGQGAAPAELNAAARRSVDAVVVTLLERESVVPEVKLVRAALLRHPGKLTPQHVLARLDEREDLIRREHRGVRQVTSVAALEEERLMCRLALDGRGRYEPLSRAPWEPAADSRLNPAQRAAVRHVLASGDRVTLVHGGAPENKLGVIREAARAAEQCGHFVRVFAPTADAAVGHLRSNGFARADTVAKLLSNTGHEARARGAVWFIDDAEQLGNRQMTATLALAKECGARVVLVGDVRQHHSFGRGEALRVLSDHAGLRPAGLTEVFHQRGRYRDAAEALSAGLAKQAVEHLAAADAFHVSRFERAARVGEGFVAALRRGRTALAVATTRKERDAISAEIRSRLKEAGVLGKARRFEVLRPAGLDVRERAESARYEPGMVVQFARGVRGVPKLGWNRFRAGERVTVIGRDPFGHVLVTGGGQLRTLPLRHADRFEVYRKGEIEIAKGDTVRVTRSGYFDGGPVRPKWDRNPVIDRLNVRHARKRTARRLVENGALLRVRGFTWRGDIKLEGGRVIPKDFAHVDHGYCLPPHAARTRTAHVVFVSMPSWSLIAGAGERLRSALHRARDRVAVFTDEKELFVERLAQTLERPSATRVVEEGQAARHEDPRAVLERVRLHREAVLRREREARERARAAARDREAERA